MRTRMMAAVAAVVALGLAGGGLSPSASAAPARKARPYVVTLKALPAQADVGNRVTLAGTVSGPDSARKPVLVQRRQDGGAWTLAVRTSTSKRGAFSVSVPLTRGGSTAFRVVKPRSRKRAQGVSAVRSVRVFEWLDLADQPLIVQSAMVVGQRVTMGSKPYDGSLVALDGSARVAVVTDGLCTDLEVYSGFSDTDAGKLVGGEAAVVSLATGSQEGPADPGAQFVTPAGAVRRLTLDVAGAYGVLLDWQVTREGSSAGFLFGIIGSPRLRCSVAELPSPSLAGRGRPAPRWARIG